MKAVVTSYRRSRHIQKPDQILIKADGINTKAKAHTLLGKKVVLPVSKKTKMLGKVFAVHGNSGVVRARFTKGVPGQAIGTECEIVE